MRKVLIALVGAATLAGLATPAAAQSAADKADARCLLVLQLAARDPKNKEMAAKGAYFYMGRLGVRGAPARLDAVLFGEARAIRTAAAAKAELDRCSEELNANGKQFQALNERLAAQARAATPPAKK